MTDFAELFYRWLPGLYRDKDDTRELRRFLDIAAAPLTEINASVEQLYEDFYINTCRDLFIPLIGGLLGVESDPTLPPWAQRVEVGNALEFYRAKGMSGPLESIAQQLTGLALSTVDFSQLVAMLPFVQNADPLMAQRNQPAGENPPGSGNFFFRADQGLQQLYDATRGRRITRELLAGSEPLFAGVDGRFSIKERGQDIFTRPGPRYSAVAADLTDFANPKTSSGAAMAIAPGQAAIDPVLGRFRIVSPLPLAGNLTVDYRALVPESLVRETFDIRDPDRMVRLGRTDDPAPYTLDVRSPRLPTDRIGRMHFDNHGFAFAPGRVMANQRPNLLAAGPPARFSFDNRPLAPNDSEGVPLQLQDGIDGSPLTRRKLAGHEAEFCGARRGFSIRIRGVNILDPAFPAKVNLRAADLTDFAQPRDLNGAALVLAASDIAVDPQLGRFLMNLAALGATVEQVRVDYLLGPARLAQNSAPAPLAAAIPELFAFSSDSGAVPLRDGFDGALIAAKLRLGVAAAQFHGKSRGWIIRRNGADVSGVLAVEIKALDPFNTPVTAGRIAIDPDRGWFKFPAGGLAPGDSVSVDFSFEDVTAEQQILASFAQRAPRMLPAGVAAVIIDSRKSPVNPAVLA